MKVGLSHSGLYILTWLYPKYVSMKLKSHARHYVHQLVYALKKKAILWA